MRIASRLVASFGALVVMTSLVAGFAIYRLAKVHESARIVEEDVVPSSRAVAAIDAAVDHLREADLQAVSAVTPAERRQHLTVGDSLIGIATAERHAYEPFIDTPEEGRLYREFSKEWNDYFILRDQFSHLIRADRADSARALVTRNSAAAFRRTAATIDALTGLTIQQAAEATRASETQFALARWIISTIAALTLIGAVLLAFFLIRSITRPLDLLVDATTHITSGDLSQRVDVHSRDEFAIVGETFNRMMFALSASHGTLEQRVAERTAELTREKEGHREARQLAELANVAKTEFLTNMSHELRTPLNSVIGFSSILLKNKNNRLLPADLQHLDRIQTNARHLLGLINAVLDLSKLEAGALEIETTSIELDVLTGDILRELEPRAAARNVRMGVDVARTPCLVDGDRKRLHQVLVNLVDNAIKFSENSEVRVVIRSDAGGKPIAVDIIDCGIGIAPDRLGSIFEAFQQADTSTSRQHFGTGLGLTISRSLAQLMGFELVVASELGKGSTFSLIFAVERAEDRRPLRLSPEDS